MLNLRTIKNREPKNNHMKLKGILIAFLGIALLTTDVSAQKKSKKNDKSENKTTKMSSNEFKNEIDSASYSLGVLIGKNLAGQGMDSLNMELFMEAMNAVMHSKDLRINEQQAQQYAQAYMSGAQGRKAKKNLDEGKAFLEANKSKAGVKVTASGLQYEVLKQGEGPKPADVNTSVTAHYHGTLINGTVFDSSVNRGQPFKTKVGQVIKAWQEALLMMNVGTKLRIYCPSDLAYGERGAGQMIGPNAVLIFEMELISIDN